jgi:CubicO group peptidase (beta-lactamase class C family)
VKPEDIMRGSPPHAEAQVTLSNWRNHPFSQWSFRNVQQLLPTASIRRARHASPLPSAIRQLLPLQFKTADAQINSVADTLRTGHADSLVVLHRGTVVTEWYDHGMTPDTPHLVCSVSKSITGTVAGVLMDRGQLNPDALVSDYVPELKDAAYGRCKVRHLLDMCSAMAFDEDYEKQDGDVVRYRVATGWDNPRAGQARTEDQRAFLAQMQSSGDPAGARMEYISTNTDMLGWVLEAASGQPFAQLLSTLIWAPMGAENDAYITLDPSGAARTAGGICVTPRDLARFGEMIRQRGLANGQQVVPGCVVDDIRHGGDAQAFAIGDLKDIFPGCRYRNQWYSLDAEQGRLGAVGIHGQWLWIDMAREVVIVKTATQPKAMDVPIDHRWLAAFSAIADHLNN